MRRKRSKPTSTVMVAELRDSNAMRKVPRSCWSEEAEEGFVVLWQQHPCLFDVSSSHFHNKEQKEKAWRDIADCLQQPVEEVKTRAASLRTQFSRLIKPRPGNEAKTLTPRQQWLLRVMDFIKPYIVHRPCEITLDMPLRDPDDSEEHEDHSDSLEFSPFTNPETHGVASASASKRKHEPDWLAFLREFQEREEDREKRAEEREDRRQREFLEREERRERERREEERKHNERRDREWREWMESLLKEERREREEREKESRAREDRLMKMIELFLMKK